MYYYREDSRRTFSLPFHSSLELLKVSELDLELLHLRLDEQRDQRLDLAFLDAGEVLRLDRRGG